MPGNSFGKLFAITNWGESHGKAIGVVIDGCPPLIPLAKEDIQQELDRRAPGQNALTTARKEEDAVEILSGVFEGKTTGAPISLMILNKDTRKEDYQLPGYRPSHADYTYEKKYGIRDPHGGGRSSARLTAGNVAAGAIARKILAQQDIEIVAYVKEIKDIAAVADPNAVKRADVDSNNVRCPDPHASARMEELIMSAKEQGDSLGGVIECVIRNTPAGLGEPVFDKLEADLAKAMLCINAAKGFEIGSGFAGTRMLGSEHNDEFVIEDGAVRTATNNSGGIQGGISNGMPIVLRVAFKPTATIRKRQRSVSPEKKAIELEVTGRHDPCVLPRAVPIVEAMAALVLCDHYLRHAPLRRPSGKKQPTS